MARSAFLGGRKEVSSILSPRSGPGSVLENGMGPGSQGGGGSLGQGGGGLANARVINIDCLNPSDPMRALMDFPRPKIPQYDFPTQADTDTTRNEIDEFYSYVEAPQITENRVNWEEWVALPPSQRGGGETGLGAGGVGLEKGPHDPAEAGAGAEDRDNNLSAPAEEQGEAFGSALGLGLGFEGSPLGESRARSGETIGEWIHLPYVVRKKTVSALLATLEVREPVARVRASRALLYLLQGAFADTTSPEHQLHWIQENARMVRSVGGVGEIFHALQVTVWKHEWLGSLPDFIPAPLDAETSTDDAEPQPLMTPQAKAEYMDEINLELALHFGQLYILMETGRGDEEWGDELMSLDPPMPIYLMNLLASLREKNAKGFPVKKLLLLTWKTILACFGGQADLARCKQLAREIEGLPPAQDQKAKAVKTKSTPNDIRTFQEEITVKYPSYHPPLKQLGELPLEQIASAITPIPQRRPFGMLDGPGGTTFSGPGGGNNGHQQGANGFPGPNGGPGGNNASPGTPAPTPPPSPKPNKLKYQTDQTRPFVFPYSLSVQGPRTVPYAIEEAGRLYRAHMHVSLEMWQMWRVREQCIFEETGVGAAPDGSRVAGLGGVHGLESAGTGVGSQAYQRRRKLLLKGDAGADQDGYSESGASGLSGSFAGLRVGEPSSLRAGVRGLALGGLPKPSPLSRRGPAGARGAVGGAGSSSQGSRSPTYTEAPPHSYLSGSNSTGDDGILSSMEAGEPTVERLQELEATLTEEIERLETDHELAALENERWTVTLTRLRQQRADARRLQRVDLLFRAILPNLHSAIIVLLKLLLAGVTAQNNTNSPHAQALAEGVPVDEAPPPTVEDIDIIRHREITTKAIGAILLLCLKWFKASHVMKFHFLSQLLVDSNCLLLILKMFGLQDHTHAVKTRNEVEMYNFFNYCYSNGGREPRMSLPEDAATRQREAAAAAASQARGKGSDEGHLGAPGGPGMGGRDSPNANPIHLADGEEYEIVSEYSWRTFYSFISFTRIIQKLTKRRVHRILLMTQYKSSAILKRMLRVNHSDLHMYILKVLKSQVPYCGRKWKQTNMKLITAIYLNCRPELRDEWLAGMDIDGGLEDSLPQEQALRALIKFYLNTRYGPLHAPGGPGAPGNGGANANGGAHGQAAAGSEAQAGPGHRRTGSSTSQFGSGGGSALANGSGEGSHGEGSGGDGSAGGSGDAAHSGGPSTGGMLRSPSGPGFFESDIFPPLRRSSESTAGTLRYIPDDVVEGYLDNYEDVLGEVFGHGNMGGAPGDDEYGPGWTSGKWGLTQEGSETAWARLGEILGTSEEDAASESATSGAGDGEGELKGDGEAEGNRTWENLSPKEMRYLSAGGADDAGLEGEDGLDRTDGNLLVAPGSPLANRRRRTSSLGGNGPMGGRSNSDSGPLRPVLDFDKPGDGSAVEDEAGNRSADGRDGGIESDGTAQNGGGVSDPIEPPLPTPIDGGIDEVAHLWGV